jgi:peptide/nickel transport system ATP-binding protein
MEILKVEHLKTYYESVRGTVKAVDDVSFTLHKGETIGLVGESGCGKSTLGLSIMRLIKPPGRIVEGRIVYDGKIDLTKIDYEELRKIRWKEIAMVFQGAMNVLNPVHKIVDQMVEAIIFHENTTKSEAVERAAKMLQLVGVPIDRMKRYPFELSGGMRQRVVIAMALLCNPKIVIADEPTTALDVVTQRNILNLLVELKRKLGLSIIFITHDISILPSISDRIMVMYAGEIVEIGDLREVMNNPLHPYTRGLLNSILLPLEPPKPFSFLPGEPPDLINPPSGCKFHPRCPYAFGKCSLERPQLHEEKPGHAVACHLYR